MEVFIEKSIEDKNYKCEQCESSYELDLHHKNYDCLGKETFSDVKVLCIDCHSKELGGTGLENNEAIKRIITAILSYSSIKLIFFKK